jgi:hypothetical protein
MKSTDLAIFSVDPQRTYKVSQQSKKVYQIYNHNNIGDGANHKGTMTTMRKGENNSGIFEIIKW